MRVVVIGAGHNGLTAAFYLARAGLKPLVLEQRETVGGGAVTGELHPGFRCPTLAHHASVRADIASDMALERHGVEFLSSPVQVFAPAFDGPPAVVYEDPVRTARSLAPVSARDGQSYVLYRAALDAVCDVVASLLREPAPVVEDSAPRDIWNLLRTARRFRALDRKDAYRLLRWAPMPVADLASEWFESEVVRALVSAPGLSGTMFGPRSAGSALVLLLERAHRLLAGRPAQVRSGPGAVTSAMAAAARAAGVEIRTGARVNRILTNDGAVTGVVLADGCEIPATTVVSAVDPKTTFLDLVGAPELPPDFVAQIRAYRARGTMAKVNLALSLLPSFDAGRDDTFHVEQLSGRIHIGPDLDYLERAFDHVKYRELSEEPWLDLSIPSILDPGLAPAGAHVVSIYAHYAPYRIGSGTSEEAGTIFLKRVIETLDRFCPGFGQSIVAAEIIMPSDLERLYGLHGGHVFHGELALDQLATMRPLMGFARYRSPVQGLYLCSAGTHPGGFMSGASGKLAAAEVRSRLRT